MKFRAILLILGLLTGNAMSGVPTCDQITDMSETLLEKMLATDTTASLNALALRLGFTSRFFL